MISLSRRSLLKAAARLGVGAGLSLLGLNSAHHRSQAQEESEEPFFSESETTLTLGNRFYEVDFDKRNGAITRIFDKRGGGVVSEGNADGSLWAIADDQRWQPLTPPRLRASSLSEFDWDETERILRFTFDVNHLPHRLMVRIDVQVSEQPWLDLTARIEHRDGPRIDWFGFPDDLGIDVRHLNQAAVPTLPGTLFQRSFFEANQSHIAVYPSNTHCADLTWLELDSGTAAMYALAPDDRVPALLGYHSDPKGSASPVRWVHRLALGINPGESFVTPTMRLAVGELLQSCIADYRSANAMDAYPPLTEKLGDMRDVVPRTAFILTSPWHSFDRNRSLFSSIEPPALIHTVVPTEQGFDTQNPDWWPPSMRAGGVAGYRMAFREAQRHGHLVMPYSNPTWWNPTSDTAQWLEGRGLSTEDIAAREPHGSPYLAQYGGAIGVEVDPSELKPGYVASPNAQHAIERLGYLMSLHSEEHSDLVFEDQVGGRTKWMIWDYHHDAPTPRAYYRGWYEHTKRHQPRRLMTEFGFDQLAEAEVGFTGTTITLEKTWPSEWDRSGWQLYPLSAMMFRDKVLLYQHNLDGYVRSRLADTLDKLRWDLACGHLLHFNFGSDDDSWLQVVLAFSHFVLGEYASELLEEWSGDLGDVTMSRFETFTVTANWTGHARRVDAHTLVPGGVVSAAHDGSVTGGVFQRFNGSDLSDGEHYLIEQRKAQGIVVRQPMGTDTHLAIRALPAWEEGTSVSVAIFNRRNDLMGAEARRVGSGDVEFDYRSLPVSEVERRAFEVSNTPGEPNGENGLRELNLDWTTTVAEVRDGRACRRETQMTPLEGWGIIAFQAAREILGGDTEADVIVEVEWYDESAAERTFSLVYDGAVLHPELHHTDPVGGWQTPVNDRQWKTARFDCPRAVFRRRVIGVADISLTVPPGVCIGKVTVTNADELERRTVAYYTIHDPAQGETLTQGLHLRGWTDATQPIADLDLDGLAAIYAWDAEDEQWQMYSPHVPTSANTLDTLEQGHAYYVRVANGQTFHWPEAPYGGVGFHLQPGRNLVCWLGTPDKPLTETIAPLRGMKAEPLVSVTLDDRTYDMEESRQATEPLAYGQALWVEIDAVGPTRWLQF